MQEGGGGSSAAATDLIHQMTESYKKHQEDGDNIITPGADGSAAINFGERMISIEKLKKLQAEKNEALDM